MTDTKHQSSSAIRICDPAGSFSQQGTDSPPRTRPGDGTCDGPAALDRVLAYRPGLRFVAISRERAMLVGEEEHFLIRGRPMVAIAELINGKRTELEILQAQPGGIDEFQALHVLTRLESKGLLQQAVRRLPPVQCEYWQRLGYAPRQVADSLGAQRVSVITAGSALPGEPEKMIRRALERVGVRTAERGVDPIDTAAILVLAADFRAPDVAEISAAARRAGASWCLVRPVGTKPWIGPTFHPRHGPCFACFGYWLRINRPVEELLHRRGIPISGIMAGSFEPATRIVCELAALTVARQIIHCDDKPVQRTLLLVDPVSAQIEHHAVRRRPQCPVCGDSTFMARQGSRPIVLQPAQKRYVDDGGYRVQSPVETYEQYQTLVSPVTGPVSHLGPMPNRYTSTRPVFVSGYRVCPPSLAIDGQSFQRVCAGKGRQMEQARASALCEAIERFSGVYQGDETEQRGSLNDLGASAIHPHELLIFSHRQYETRPKNQERAVASPPSIPLPYDPRQKISWTPAWSISHQRQRFVPLSYCFAEAPQSSGADYCPYNGNGAAAGNCVEEAVLQGLLELIERDAVAIWWYNRLRLPAVDLTGFDTPYFTQLQTEYAGHDWSLWVLDLTHDLGIPTYAALAQSDRENRFSVGFGCHLNARLATQRALTELNQLFDPGGELRAPWDHDKVDEKRFLFPQGSKTAPTANQQHNTDLRADIETCSDRLKTAGLETLVVNKTRPDIGLSVVHVIVPGLRHFWPRLGPGRLYTVPTQLGWQRRRWKEEELNPVPLLL